MWNWRRRGTGWNRGQVPGSRSAEPRVPGRRRCHDGRGRRSCACATATAPGGTWRDFGGDRPSLTPALADVTCDRAGPATRGLRGAALVWSDGPLSPRHLVTGHGKPGSGPGSCDGQTLRAWVWPHSSPAGGCAPPVCPVIIRASLVDTLGGPESWPSASAAPRAPRRRRHTAGCPGAASPPFTKTRPSGATRTPREAQRGLDGPWTRQLLPAQRASLSRVQDVITD